MTEETKETVSIVSPKLRGKGRPPKSDLQAVKNRTKNKVGRPVGDTGGTRILDKMIQIALNDEHPGQMAAIKLAMDRILPASVFDTAKSGGSMPSISINISGLNSPTLETVEDITDIDTQ